MAGEIEKLVVARLQARAGDVMRRQADTGPVGDFGDEEDAVGVFGKVDEGGGRWAGRFGGEGRLGFVQDEAARADVVDGLAERRTVAWKPSAFSLLW